MAICKGAPKVISANSLPVIGKGLTTKCTRFINKAYEEACQTHRFVEDEQKMT